MAPPSIAWCWRVIGRSAAADGRTSAADPPPDGSLTTTFLTFQSPGWEVGYDFAAVPMDGVALVSVVRPFSRGRLWLDGHDKRRPRIELRLLDDACDVERLAFAARAVSALGGAEFDEMTVESLIQRGVDVFHHPAGELNDRTAMSLVGYYMMYACADVRDYERVAQWCERLSDFCQRWGIRPLFAVCRSVYGEVLMCRGEWEDAEAELVSATGDLIATRPGQAGQGLVRLAELRRRQGRREEARQLFHQVDWHPGAQLGLAELTFECGDFRAAAALARRSLPRLPASDREERVAALELVVRAGVAAGEPVEAELGKLSEAVAAIGSLAFRASWHWPRARSRQLLVAWRRPGCVWRTRSTTTSSAAADTTCTAAGLNSRPYSRTG